uniref:(California timema) hypothetical protein n=1 Tax=Timema californicum TaxID=61474 RepID=A0A7R9J5A1_TIMCA|nr:unnamed protein product [Timema californicum]
MELRVETLFFGGLGWATASQTTIYTSRLSEQGFGTSVAPTRVNDVIPKPLDKRIGGTGKSVVEGLSQLPEVVLDGRHIQVSMQSHIPSVPRCVHNDPQTPAMEHLHPPHICVHQVAPSRTCIVEDQPEQLLVKSQTVPCGQGATPVVSHPSNCVWSHLSPPAALATTPLLELYRPHSVPPTVDVEVPHDLFHEQDELEQEGPEFPSFNSECPWSETGFKIGIDLRGRSGLEPTLIISSHPISNNSASLRFPRELSVSRDICTSDKGGEVWQSTDAQSWFLHYPLARKELSRMISIVVTDIHNARMHAPPCRPREPPNRTRQRLLTARVEGPLVFSEDHCWNGGALGWRVSVEPYARHVSVPLVSAWADCWYDDDVTWRPGTMELDGRIKDSRLNPHAQRTGNRCILNRSTALIDTSDLRFAVERNTIL